MQDLLLAWEDHGCTTDEYKPDPKILQPQESLSQKEVGQPDGSKDNK